MHKFLLLVRTSLDDLPVGLYDTYTQALADMYHPDLPNKIAAAQKMLKLDRARLIVGTICEFDVRGNLVNVNIVELPDYMMPKETQGGA